MNDDELVAAGLYDPDGDEPSRAVFVRRCLDIGLTVEEIRDAGDELIDRAVVRIHYGGGERLTTAEIAERSGIPVSQIELIARASGRLLEDGSDEPVFEEDDLAGMSMVGIAIDLLGEEAVVQIVRASAAAVARIGDAIMSGFLTGVAAPAMRDDSSGLALLEANLAAAQLLPQFGGTMTQMLRHYMQQSYRPSSDVSLETALAHGVDTRLLAVGFADLVGSTELADRATLADLNDALDLFERTATDIVVGRGGRIVKFIGDEVMFRAPSSDVACQVAVDLVAAIRDDTVLPALRVGLAFGDVLTREGDFYGPTVNLAARVTKLAQPHGIVASSRIVDALERGENFHIESLGTIELRGVTEPVEVSSLSSVS